MGISNCGRASFAVPKWGKLDVMRNPGCGCCEKWTEGLKAAGFEVNMSDNPDLGSYRARLGLPADLAGCHIGKIGGYIIGGHVPAADIVKLLLERPEALGLAVPGMLMGSPGMETDGQSGPFQVVMFKRDGSRAVFATY